jgi:predicted 3-demethylubiquinone-9 3-methyltransferase (glyoxalase superfamily)
MAKKHDIAPCLWFDGKAEEAAKFYVGIFPNSKILQISHYPSEGQDVHHQPAGRVMTVELELDGHHFTALNAGPEFKFSEAISFQIFCETQKEIDSYWEKLSAGGDPQAQQCGWVKDRFGVSWQIVPTIIREQMAGDPKKYARAFKAMLSMKKLDIAALRKAFDEG